MERRERNSTEVNFAQHPRLWSAANLLQNFLHPHRDTQNKGTRHTHFRSRIPYHQATPIAARSSTTRQLKKRHNPPANDQPGRKRQFQANRCPSFRLNATQPQNRRRKHRPRCHQNPSGFLSTPPAPLQTAGRKVITRAGASTNSTRPRCHLNYKKKGGREAINDSEAVSTNPAISTTETWLDPKPRGTHRHRGRIAKRTIRRLMWQQTLWVPPPLLVKNVFAAHPKVSRLRIGRIALPRNAVQCRPQLFVCPRAAGEFKHLIQSPSVSGASSSARPRSENDPSWRQHGLPAMKDKVQGFCDGLRLCVSRVAGVDHSVVLQSVVLVFSKLGIHLCWRTVVYPVYGQRKWLPIRTPAHT